MPRPVMAKREKPATHLQALGIAQPEPAAALTVVPTEAPVSEPVAPAVAEPVPAAAVQQEAPEYPQPGYQEPVATRPAAPPAPTRERTESPSRVAKPAVQLNARIDPQYKDRLVAYTRATGVNQREAIEQALDKYLLGEGY